MAAHFFQETDLIEVANPPVLLYGVPGSGKTSIAQTADKPLTMDFDNGIHRSQFRKAAVRFDAWEDVVQAQKDGLFDPYRTIVPDTVDTLLKLMSMSIIRDNAKLGTRAGGLSQQGWGVLKGTFDQWLTSMRQQGKQIILIAHQKEEKDGEEKRLRPDISGGSYSIVMQNSDIVGYVSYRNNKRFISWEPTDAYFAKNGAQLESGPIPDFTTSPTFMADMLLKAKANLGRTAQSSATVAAAVAEWGTKIVAMKSDAEINGAVPAIAELAKTSKAAAAQVNQLRINQARALGLEWDADAKTYLAKKEAAKPTDQSSEDVQWLRDKIEMTASIKGVTVRSRLDGKKLKDLTAAECKAVLDGLNALPDSKEAA